MARIPQELNTISQLNAHFQKFGNIVNIQVRTTFPTYSHMSCGSVSLPGFCLLLLVLLLQLDPANKQAFVQFTSNAEALLALRSPEAVMNNRFIQVYLKKDEAQEGGAPAPVVPQPPRPVRHSPPV